jgi:hypothetical protein
MPKEVPMSEFKFETVKFLELLVEACASAEREGKQFEADPSKLGPRLEGAYKSFAEQEILLEALLDNRWVSAQSPEDQRFRVWSADTGKILKGQEAGSDDQKEAIHVAILGKFLQAAAQQLSESDPSQSSD